jgi:hypothetical protein
MATTTTAADLEAGKLDKRLEAAITTGMNDGINEVARELAGSASIKMFRSKAVRVLLVEAIAARRAKAARAAVRG